MTGTFSQLYLLGNALRFAEQNHRAISNNVANFNTPGFQAQEISFDDYLQHVERAVADHEILESLELRKIAGLTERADGNNVNMDQQVASLNKNYLAFQTYSQLLASKLSTLRRAING
jgi:flagellar basal-body rod protein FlgB